MAAPSIRFGAARAPAATKWAFRRSAARLIGLDAFSALHMTAQDVGCGCVPPPGRRASVEDRRHAPQHAPDGAFSALDSLEIAASSPLELPGLFENSLRELGLIPPHLRGTCAVVQS